MVVQHLDCTIMTVLQQDVFRLQVTVDNSLLLQKAKRVNQLGRELVHELHVEAFEVLKPHEFVQVV